MNRCRKSKKERKKLIVLVSCGSSSIHQHARVTKGPSPLFFAPRILQPHEEQLFISSGMRVILSKLPHTSDTLLYPQDLKRDVRPVPAMGTFFTAVIPYEWPFTRPWSVLSPQSSREAVCKTWHVQRCVTL